MRRRVAWSSDSPRLSTVDDEVSVGDFAAVVTDRSHDFHGEQPWLTNDTGDLEPEDDFEIDDNFDPVALSDDRHERQDDENLLVSSRDQRNF